MTSPAPVPAATARPEGELTLTDLLNVLLRHRRLVLAPALLLLVLSIGLSIGQKQTWTSVSSFAPQTGNRNAGLSGLAAQFGVAIPQGGAGQSLEFYSELISSHELLLRIAETRYQVRTDTGQVNGTLLDLYRVKAPNADMRRELVVERLGREMRATTEPLTGLVRVHVTAPWPTLAADINRQMLALVNEFNLTTRRSQALEERKFAGERLAEVRGELRAAEDRLADFLRRNRAFRNSPELNFQYERLSRQVQFQQDLYTTLAQGYEQAKIEEVRTTPVISVIEQPRVPVKPNPRGRVKRAALSIILGLTIGVLLAFLREAVQRQRRAGTPAYRELEQNLGRFSRVLGRAPRNGQAGGSDPQPVATDAR